MDGYSIQIHLADTVSFPTVNPSSATPIAIELLDLQSRTRPDQIAIVTPDRSITFGDLTDRVHRLSGAVIDQCPPCDWLPVLVDRSIESVIALLAVIRAGRAFVPIDSSLPAARIGDLLHRSGSSPTAVVAHSDLAHLLPDGVVPVENASSHRSAPPVAIQMDAPGSLIFTSGSTGEPKGVIRTWAALDAPIRAFVGVDRVDHERAAMIRPMSFSAGLLQILALAAGDTLCLVDPRTMSGGELMNWFARVEVTNVALGQGLSNLLLHQSKRLLPTARTFSVFGLACDWSMIPRIRAVCHPSVVVTNQYNSTEVGQASFFRIGPDDELLTGQIPIGRIGEAPSVRLDDIGERCEMLIRDPYSLGYFNNDALTRSKFVLDADGVRWWRSGDIVHVDDRGFLHLDGRSDDMVKINGMLVYPSESERVLRTAPGIRDGAVLTHTTTTGGSRLVAHICVDDDAPSPGAIRKFLADRLPSHLVPAVLVRHDSLPYTDRQKLDRRALLSQPIERWTDPIDIRKYPMQTYWLASKIEQVIGLGRVDPSEDIWEAGLDSMGAVELCSLIAAEGLGDIDPRVLLSARTAEDLDRHLQVRSKEGLSSVVVFNAAGSSPPIFAIPGTTGTAFAYRSLSECLGSHQPVVVIEPRGMHCKGKIERTVDERVQHIVEEVDRRLDSHHPCLILGHSGGTTYALEAARILIHSGREVHLIFLDGAPNDSRTRSTSSPFTRKIRSETRKFSSPGSFARWTLSVIRRAPLKTWNMAMMPILVRFPGKRRYTVDHYKIFWWIQRRALKNFTLAPVDVPVTLLHVNGNDLSGRIAPWVGSLDIHEVGGDHISMLYPPHVHQIAEHVVRQREHLLARV